MANDINYDDIIKKYQQMVNVRKESGDINIDDYLPSLSEMIKEDCVWDSLKAMQSELSTSRDPGENIAYYTSNPPITEPGYYPDSECFVLRASNFAVKKGDWELGNIDGDTWPFNLSDLDIGGKFKIGETEYKDFREYSENMGIGLYDRIDVRSISIDSSEILHMSPYTIKPEQCEMVSFDDARLKGYSVAPYKIDMRGSYNPKVWRFSEYKGNEKIKFYKSGNTGIQVMEGLDPSKLSGVYDKCNAILLGSSSVGWGKETITDGYKAQARAREIIEHENIKDIIVIIDRNIVNGKRVENIRVDKDGKSHVYYNSVFFTIQNIQTLVYDLFERDLMDFSLSTSSILPFGCDKYGRCLGNVWVKIGTSAGDTWVDLSKYVMTGTSFTKNNPNFADTDLQEIYGGASSVFKQWTNTSNQFRYVDSLTNSGKLSYSERIALHKKLTGIDFAQARDHTVLLGDTLFMIPPEAIHTSSTLDYEKLPIIRGKGSMMKNKRNVEELLELELYFNNEYGINGIPYEITTPSGTKLTYYMNGLRSLIAQFKVAPFLPIENHYINDVLNIEVVSLVNISISTVEGFPKLLKVILTLRDFNYRVFMPDLPIPDYDSEASEISEMQHIFAKCFNWDLFRYYYQRGIINGDMLQNYKYNTYEYKDFLYSNKNMYKTVDLTDSDFEIYVPDIEWLKYALQIKKTRDSFGPIDAMEETNKNTTSSLGATFITILNDNKPYFSKNELDPVNHQKLSQLDGLGRCGEAFAVIGYEMMPKEGENRGDISSVTPSGWSNKSYDFLRSSDNSSGSVYNRCHLIGYQLTGLNAEPKNLVTGTRYLNVGDGKNNPLKAGDPLTGGMLYYENLVSQYIERHPENHVAYKVTPVYDGDNLVPSAVIMEGYSIEDKGEDISFNVYIANIQPGIAINYKTGETEKDNKAQNLQIKNQYYNYKDPRTMEFVPYLTDNSGNSIKIELDGISFNTSNYFTETHLKAMDGFAPQYMGGSDTSIELKMTLTNEYLVGILKNLPHVIMDMIRNYRRVMPCFPLKIKNEYMQMMGIDEVILDNVAVSTKPGFPGVFDVVINLTSMDRSMRQREALEKANTKGLTSSSAALGIYDYFNLERTLASAELYPDLDLPTIKELEDLGWRFAKWANEDRVYVDPDFYICYSFQYASKLIKEIINNVLYQVTFNAGVEDATGKSKTGTSTKNKSNQLNKTRLIGSDCTGADINPGVEYDGVSIDKEYGYSKLYDDILKGVQSNVNNEEEKRKNDPKTLTRDKVKTITNEVKMLTALGIENGWQINPGWHAPLCGSYINEELEKYKYSGIKQKAESNTENSQYLEEIYDLRHRAIMLIDRILDEPLKCTNDVASFSGHSKEDTIRLNITNAVDTLFSGSNGRQLLELLCPMQDEAPLSKHDLQLKPDYFKVADPLRWLKGYLFALACVRSGKDAYGENKKENDWLPRQFQDMKYENDDKEAAKAGYKNAYVPFNKVELKRVNAGDMPLARTYDSWYSDGVSFGAGQITKLSREIIRDRLQPTSKIKYFNYQYKGGASEYYNNMYHKTKRAGRKRFCETGFIDPYYNYAGYKSKEGKEYINLISTKWSANFEALLRETLMYLKFLIMEGYIFSEIDIISKDWENVINESLTKQSAVGGKSTQDTRINYFVNSYRNDLIEGYYDTNGDNDEDGEVEDGLKDAEFASKLKEEIPKSYNKIFCSRLIYPFMMAACNGNKNILKLLKNRDYNTLDSYTLGSSVGGSNESSLNRFLSSMFGAGMISSSDIKDSEKCTSNTQKIFNTLMQEAFTAMSNDPRCYAFHSLYDMCVTDKRGRLLRAFPCYYVLFVDEGRTIGSWKLFDNFYNMSSISNIQVVKSRKMPADTCTFTMSNMFMSYADHYDNTIYQQYVDVYGFGDVFSSIFSPRDYISKEDMIKQRKQLTDTTPITAGVRLHVRMGYGSDGSKLPIVFNGKVAEVNCGETVDIVAQGDGHELNNPLNTLGELTARNFEESQGWFTWFKDIRGAIARGGETPRNLLAKLSTAQYGGLVKTVIREKTEGRFFYDNPFGIYHFGDKRFKDIFEDSEIVQNMYEVSNKQILNGVNDLLGDESTVRAAPIINCNIQDKTLWEIGHMCANSGDDFYFAVRDFGLRSTMCLCKANHYYAYAYKYESKNQTIIEKRKPFQQYHYYDSYNDIIYNSIKASETNMKTNAVGTWEGSDWLWGHSQQSVGPIYLDIDIYPEYQKSMMVDTGLVAGGDGGINIPIINYLTEKFDYDEYAGRVNKSLAEKITTNVLRQSVKDMYDGEVCIIGDTSLKPYDRATIVDVYEDMSGDIEIETVIHSMNIETGFTTTFIPDVIVRSENSCQECGYQSVMSSLITSIATVFIGKGVIMASAHKAGGGLLKLGEGQIVKRVGEKFIKKGATNAINTFFNSFIDATTGAVVEEGAPIASRILAKASFMANPYVLGTMAITAGCVFMLCANWKESFFRFLRNAQALTVFPITKNGRLLIAGMSGHKGSVYGFNYSKTQANNSLKGYLMKFLEGDTDNGAINIAGGVAKWLLADDNYELTKQKWINNLGLNTSNDIIEGGSSNSRNEEAFRQYLTSSISREFSSRASSLAAMKTKPRITSFNTSNRTNSVYMKYQIGGVYDKPEYSEKEYGKALTINDLSTNERIKALIPVEDDPEIKMAKTSGVHPVIKKMMFYHSRFESEFPLKLENENTVISYVIEDGNPQIYDLPMLQEDALIILKLIINTDNMKNKTVTFMSGTRVNSTASWKSTGFAFSLSCDDMTALEAASAKVRESSSWYSKNKYSFSYSRTANTIQYTVYAPIDISSNSILNSIGGKDDE